VVKIEKSSKNTGSDEPVRLNKFLSDCGVASRRKADELISEGRVMVNGVVTNTAGAKINPEHDIILVNRKPIKVLPKGIVLLHKPRGVVTTLSDPEGRRCIADYLGKRFRGYYPAGRLDWDSSGLVILTNNGDVADQLMHPRFGASRTYHVRVEGRVTEAVCEKLLAGITLNDGPVQVQALSILPGEKRVSANRSKAPELLSSEESTWLEITIKEGRNRIVRRIFESVGHAVIKLKRMSHGPFRLGALASGQIRALSEREYRAALRKLSMGIETEEYKPRRIRNRNTSPQKGKNEQGLQPRVRNYKEKTSPQRSPAESQERKGSRQGTDNRRKSVKNSVRVRNKA
jgi:23S rRNA pseudouridine2605 synthase